jgi:hypothetical protein
MAMPDYLTSDAEYQNKIQDERIAHLETDFKAVCSMYNHEIGEVRDSIGEVKQDIAQVKQDVDWLKRSYWAIAIPAIGAFLVALLNLLSRTGEW